VTNSVHALLRRAASFAAAFGLALGATEGAAGFQFSPVRVNLTARDPVGSITLTNADDAPLRLEIQAFHWTQRVDGRPALEASDALLVFPQLLTIPPHEHRSLRLAMTDQPAPGEREAAYKVSITEIGSFSTPKTRGAGIAISMQANLPVFIAPTVERRAGAIAGASVQKRTLSFAVVNVGTLHFVTKDLRVTGIGSDTRPLFSQALDGGDVLADGKREYRVDLPRKQCGVLRALTIRLKADDQQLIQTLDVPAGTCNP
jgi:P pilus assembly chaperone PapD